MLTEKAYDATVRLGATTTTDDAEGEVVATASTSGLDDETIRTAAATFVGTLQQVPSAVSAVKVDGKRAYARVRAGESVELEPRTVTVHELVVHDVRSGDGVHDLDISVRCSSGTYVRAIARDLGSSLGVGGHLTCPPPHGGRALRPRSSPHPRASSPTTSNPCRSPTPPGRRSHRST